MGNNLPSKGRRRLPGWVRILLLVFAAVVVLGLTLPYFLNVDRYRPMIVAAIEQATGRKAALGPIRARFLPTLGFSVDSVHLGNPAGFPAGDLVSVETLRCGLAWGPLFHRQVQVTSIDLDKPKLTLMTEASGRTNYEFTSNNANTRGSASAGDSSRGSSFSLQGIEEVSLHDAQIAMGNIAHGRLEPDATVQGLNVQLHNLAFDSTMMKRIEAEVRLNGVRVETSSLAVPIEMQSGKVTLKQGRAEGDFRAKIGKDVDAKGTLHVADFAKPVLEFSLSTSQLDIAALANLFAGPNKEGHDPPAAPSAPSKSELLAKGKIVAERIRYGNYSANNAIVEVRLFSDRIEVFPGHLDVYAGTLQIAARADRMQSPLRFSMNLKLNGIDVGKLISVDPSMKGKMTGTGEMSLEVIGSGGPQLLGSLKGTGDFAVRDGQLPGLNLPGALASIAKFAGSSGSSSTPFKLIQGDLAIAQGRVSSNKIHMDSSVGTVDLSGSFGFDSTVNYNGQATLVPGAGGSSTQELAVGALTGLLGSATGKQITKATVPFSVGGTFSNIKVRPGNSIPKVEYSTPAQTAAPAQTKPSLTDALKGLFKKP